MKIDVDFKSKELNRIEISILNRMDRIPKYG